MRNDLADFTVEIGTVPGLEPAAWEDVTDRIEGPDAQLTFEYGRGNELSQDESGTGGFLLRNTDHHWGPGIPPSTAVRVIVTDDTLTDHAVLYHLIGSAPAEWPGSGTDAVIPVEMEDGLSLLSTDTYDNVTRDRELSGARIDALLDLAGWPAGMRDLDAGTVRVDAIDDAPVTALDGIREAVRAEQGQLFIAPDGKLTFRDRHDRLDVAVALTVGAIADDDIPDLSDLTSAYDLETTWPVARVELADGTVIEYEDDTPRYGALTAAEAHGRRQFPMVDLPVAEVDAGAVAAWMVVRYSVPRRRIESLVLTAANQAHLLALLALRPGQAIQIDAAATEAAPAIDEKVYVERLAHEVYADQWVTTLALSPDFYTGPWLRFDDATVGFDVGGLAP